MPLPSQNCAHLSAILEADAKNIVDLARET